MSSLLDELEIMNPHIEKSVLREMVENGEVSYLTDNGWDEDIEGEEEDV